METEELGNLLRGRAPRWELYAGAGVIVLGLYAYYKKKRQAAAIPGSPTGQEYAALTSLLAGTTQPGSPGQTDNTSSLLETLKQLASDQQAGYATFNQSLSSGFGGLAGGITSLATGTNDAIQKLGSGTYDLITKQSADFQSQIQALGSGTYQGQQGILANQQSGFKSLQDVISQFGQNVIGLFQQQQAADVGNTQKLYDEISGFGQNVNALFAGANDALAKAISGAVDSLNASLKTDFTKQAAYENSLALWEQGLFNTTTQNQLALGQDLDTINTDLAAMAATMPAGANLTKNWLTNKGVINVIPAPSQQVSQQVQQAPQAQFQPAPAGVQF